MPLLSRPAQAAPRTRDALSRRSPFNVALTRDRVSPTAHTHTNAHHVPLRLLPDNHTLHDTGVHGDGPVHRRRAEPSSCSATSSAVSRCRQHPVRRRRRHRPLRRVACAVARPAAWPPPARTWPRLEPGLGRSRPEPKNGAQLGLRSEQERVRAAVLSTASSRCGLLGLALDEIFSLASRLRWLAPKSFLSVRFSCFSSKRPNSAAMTDVGAARVRREAFAFAGVSQKKFGGVRAARDGLRPKERVLRMQNLMFFSHTTQTQTQTLRSPQLPRWQGDASPDGGGGPPRSYSAALR